MIPLLNQQLFMSLAHAAQHPDSSFLHTTHIFRKPKSVTHITTKNAHRIHRLRKNKVLDNKNKTLSGKTDEVLTSIAEEISLARDVAHELYVDKEITSDDWKQTKTILKTLSVELVKKKENLLD